MPILSSTIPLKGSSSNQLKQALIDRVFVDATLKLAAQEEKKIKERLHTFNTKKKPDFLKQALDAPNNEALFIFATPAGQAFFYWLYNALNFDLLFAANSAFIQDVNTVKAAFAATLGNPRARAEAFRKKLINIDCKVLFAQEVDTYIIETLTRNKLFLPLDTQQKSDDAIVLLRSDFWEPDYEIVSFADQKLDYKWWQENRVSAVLAKQKDIQQLFLLASGHGHAKFADDGRDQIRKLVAKATQLTAEKGQIVLLIIGIDANTKTPQEVHELEKLVQELGLVATHVGPTVVKMRMITVQNDKEAKPALDEEDYIIVTKGQLFLDEVTVGFGKPGTVVDTTVQLPNINNQSDHYAVSAVIKNKAAMQKGTRTPKKTKPTKRKR